MNLQASSGSLREQLRDLGAALQNNLSQAVRVVSDAVYRDAKGTTLFKDRSGETRGAITETVNGLSGKVTRGRKRYMSFLANGTRPHVIEARRSGTLAFQMNGQTMFRQRVNHPGTAPRPFMQHAYDVGARTLRPVAERFVDAAIRHFNGT